METAGVEAVYRFEGFTLDLVRGALLGASGKQIPLRRKSFDLLRLFVENAGRLLDRETINRSVWSDVVVTDDSITQCVHEIRRALGDEAQRILKTVPRRGYIFAARVTPAERPQPSAAGTSALQLSLAKAPRLSLVVLPFEMLGGNANEEYLADAITDDLTADLSALPDVLVIARHSAAALKGKSIDVRQVGEQLGVRYVVAGSVRKLADMLRVSVQLISAETNTHVWAGHFDQTVKDLGIGQEEVVSRLSAALGIQMFDAESARGMRERPDNPDALDLLLRGWSASRKGASPSFRAQATALFEEALRVDPSCVPAMCYLAVETTNSFLIPDYPARGDENLIERAAGLIARAAAIKPGSERVMYAQGLLLRAYGNSAESIATFQRLIELYPNTPGTYRLLGNAKLSIGQADEAIVWLQRSLRLDPLFPFNRHAYQRIGIAQLLLGRYQASIEWHLRALADGTSAPPTWLAQCYLFMASAFALSGRLDDAHRALCKANNLWPFATVQSLPPTMVPRGLPHPAYLAQMRRVQDGLRLAGLRNHADEVDALLAMPQAGPPRALNNPRADYGITPGGMLHGDVGNTPTTVPGAATIRTAALVDFVSRQKPMLIDVALDSWGQSIPGAIGLQGTGHGARFSDNVQNRFNRKVRDLTGGDLSTPIVAFGVNSERFTGYNLALRLAALGCRQVYWYRGGFETWQVNRLPEADLVLHDW